jgi:superfamily II DNA/RNA helicase
MSFTSRGLSPDLFRVVTEKDYIEPTSNQYQTIPVILKDYHGMGGIS